MPKAIKTCAGELTYSEKHAFFYSSQLPNKNHQIKKVLIFYDGKHLKNGVSLVILQINRFYMWLDILSTIS